MGAVGFGSEPRFRLRYRDREIPLGEGRWSIGRSSASDIQIDDPLVSRRHAVLGISGEQTRLEDTSRHGVLVNGAPVDGSRVLSHGDRITVGDHQMMFLDQQARTRERMRTASMPRLREETLSSPETGAAPEEETSIGVSAPMLAFRAQKALEEKEDPAMAAAAVGELVDHLATGAVRGSTAAELLPIAARYAIRTAVRTGDPGWIERLFELSLARRHVLDGDTIDELYEAVEDLAYRPGDACRRYVGELGARADDLPFEQKVQVKRLTALCRATAG